MSEEVQVVEEQAAEAIRKALPAAYVAEIEGRDPEQKKRRKIEERGKRKQKGWKIMRKARSDLDL